MAQYLLLSLAIVFLKYGIIYQKNRVMGQYYPIESTVAHYAL